MWINDRWRVRGIRRIERKVFIPNRGFIPNIIDFNVIKWYNSYIWRVYEMDGLVKELSEDYQLDDCIRNDNTIVFRISLCRKGFIPIMKEKYYSGSVIKTKFFALITEPLYLRHKSIISIVEILNFQITISFTMGTLSK